MRDALSKEVGRAIRVLRRLRKLSYTEFAEKAELSATYLRQVERGKRDLGIGALGSIARGLQCDVRLLLPGDGRSPAAAVVADIFDQSPEALQEAILFLLVAEDDSPKKQAILALASEERERPRSQTRSSPPSRSSVGGPSSAVSKSSGGGSSRRLRLR